MRGELLPVHVRPYSRRRSTPNVDEFRIGTEDHFPAPGTCAVAEVDLFVEHEEALVEPSDLVKQLPPDEEYCTYQELRFAARAVAEAGAVERVQRPASRPEPAQKQIFGPEAPEGWKPTDCR